MAETKPRKAPAKKAAAAAAQSSEQPQAASASSSSVVIIKGKPLSTRGRTYVGTVISNRMSKTVTVEWERRKFVAKYQRYEKRRTRVKAHDETDAKVGDKVEIIETRPISKTKNFLVVRKL